MSDTGPSALDGTLRAVVAADRLAVSEASEGSELVRRRLTVFYGYFALLGTLGTFVGRAGRFPIDADPAALGLLLDLQSAHALVQCATFLALRSAACSPRDSRSAWLVAEHYFSDFLVGLE